MNRQYCTLIVFLVFAAAHSSSEETRLPFFQPDAVLAESAHLFPAFTSWAGFTHTLNQADSPDMAQSLDTGSILTFYAHDRLAVSGIVREVFQFRASPSGDWAFWARALVTDLRLETTIRAAPLALTAGYRHDCKHDTGDLVRDVIHDAVFARVGYPVSTIAFLPPLPNSRAGIQLTGEVNLATLFQAGPEEPDRFRVSAEAEFIPFAAGNGSWKTFIDGNCSFINRAQGNRVASASAWNVDALGRIGAEFRAGSGSVRLFYSLERVTDDWATLSPEIQTISAITLLAVFQSPEIR